MGAQWPFTVVLSWDKGRARTLSLHISLWLDGGLPQRGVRSLLSQLFPAQGNPVGRASSRLSGGILTAEICLVLNGNLGSPDQHPLHGRSLLVSKSFPNFKIFCYTVRWSLKLLETQCLLSSVRACDLVPTNLNLRVWARWHRCQELVLKLGNNVCLYFSLPFSAHGDANTTVCNSQDGRAWGSSSESLPFSSSLEVSWRELCIASDRQTWPSRCQMDTLSSSPTWSQSGTWQQREASGPSVWPLSKGNQPMAPDKGSCLCSS